MDDTSITQGSQIKKFTLFQLFRDISIASKLYFIIGIMALLIVIELSALVFSINALSSVRAYVGAEGLWSKSQKNAIYILRKYASSGKEEDYQEFLHFLKVPLGDRVTRIEMGKENPNYDIMYKGFLEGGNHPNDIDGMINLFERFHDISYINKAIKIWTKGDSLLADLQKSADKLHTFLLVYGNLQTTKIIEHKLNEIDKYNIELTTLENAFSAALGEGARWLENLILRILLFIALTVELAGIILGISISVTISKGIKEVIRVATKIINGDFSERAIVFSEDEIGSLSRYFNKMADELELQIQQLKASEEKFRGLLESAPDAVVIAGADGKILIVNKQTEQLFGYTKDEIIGQPVELLIPQRFQKNHPEHRNNFFAEPKVRVMGVGLELFGKRKNGEEFPVEISLSPLKTKDGIIVSASIRDISERNKTEKEIRRQKDLYNTLLNALSEMGEGIAITQGQKFIYVNSALCGIYGYSSEELMAMNSMMEIIVPEEKKHLVERLSRRLSGKDISVDYNSIRIIRKDGKIIDIDYVAQVINTDDGNTQLVSIIRDISERKKAEEKLKSVEEQFRLIVENVKDYGMILLDTNGIIKSWNEGAKRIEGYSAEEIIGKHISVFYTEDEIKNNEPNENLKKAKENGRFETQGWRVRKDGSQFFTDALYTVLYDDKNNFIGYAKITRDITERKNIENKLIEYNERFFKIFEKNPIAMTLSEIGTNKIISANNLFHNYFGYSNEEVIGHSAEELKLTSPEENARLFPLLLDLLKEKRSVAELQALPPEESEKLTVKLKEAMGDNGIEVNYTRKNGKTFVALVSYDVVEINNVKYTISSYQDISERKKVEKEIKESQERFLKIFEDNPVAMTLSKIGTNKILFVNKLFHKYFGYSNEEVIGHTAEELNLTSPEENERLYPLLLDLLKEKRSVAELQALPLEESEKLTAKLKEAMGDNGIEVNYRRKNGGTFVAVASYDMVEINNEKCTITSYQDISERKKIEIELQKFSVELEMKNKELEQFAYIASHDLQEPLRTVTNYVGLFAKQYEGKLDKNSEEYLHFIIGATSRMQTLIYDLLEYSRIGRDKIVIEIDCNKVLQDVLKDLDESIKESKADIKADKLPTIKGYPVLKSLFQNLISNAIKFRKKNTPLIINITVQSKKDEWLFAIKDNGIGIDKMYYDKLFKIFMRLHSQQEYAGTGIGLAQCKKIIELHQGKIWIESEPEKGSTFYFTIPKI